jgi:hypothetical protein
MMTRQAGQAGEALAVRRGAPVAAPSQVTPTGSVEPDGQLQP